MVTPQDEANWLRSDCSEASTLYMPLRAAHHPEISRLEASVLAWAERTELDQLYPRQALADLRIGYLIGSAFPGASVEALRFICNWTLLFCVVDDLVEQPGTDTHSLAETLRQLAATLHGERSIVTGHRVVAHSACALHRQLVTHWAPPRLERFHAEVRKMFCSYVWESSNRALELRPHISTYVQLRRFTSGMRVQFSFIPIVSRAGRRPQPQERLTRLETWANDLIAWTNDLWTYHKEAEAGENHNMLRLLMEHDGLDLERATRRLMGAHNRRMRDFVELSDEVRGDADAPTGELIDVLQSCVRGHYDWAGVTSRYRRIDAGWDDASARPAPGDPALGSALIERRRPADAAQHCVAS